MITLVPDSVVKEEEHHQIRDPRWLVEATDGAGNRTFSSLLILGRKCTVYPQGKSESADLAAHLVMEMLLSHLVSDLEFASMRGAAELFRWSVYKTVQLQHGCKGLRLRVPRSA